MAAHDRGPKVGYVDEAEQYFVVWKCLLPQPAVDAGLGATQHSSLERAAKAGRWVVVLASGGHFAAAVFDWSDAKRKKGAPATVVANKTFHRYVVRAKAGGRQSTKDGAGGKNIKSAGSSLRRHNEVRQSLTRAVMSWARRNRRQRPRAGAAPRALPCFSPISVHTRTTHAAWALTSALARTLARRRRRWSATSRR